MWFHEFFKAIFSWFTSFKICQIVADTSMTTQFHEFFECIFWRVFAICPKCAAVLEKAMMVFNFLNWSFFDMNLIELVWAVLRLTKLACVWKCFELAVLIWISFLVLFEIITRCHFLTPMILMDINFEWFKLWFVFTSIWI